MTREEANALTDVLYDAGFDVVQEIVHPLDHPSSTRKEHSPWVTLRVSGPGLRYNAGDLQRIVEIVAQQNKAEELTFSVHDGIKIR